MTKIDLPYLFAPKNAKGVRYYYYRRAGLRIPIKDAEGKHLTPTHSGFAAAWQAIHDTFASDEKPVSPSVGTLAHVIDAYRESPDFKQLADKTRKDYSRYLDALKKRHGTLSVAAMPREFVLGLRDKYADKPRTANYLIQVLRLVLSFAEDRQRMFRLPLGWANPARRPKLLKTGDGHRPWEEHEIEAFRKAWKPGTLERTAFELGLNTGQRGQDLIAMARFHIKQDGSISVVQEKTSARIDVPISQDLNAALSPYFKKHKHVMMLTTTSGKAFKVDHFRHIMRAAYRAARLPDDCTTHGLRYTAATILYELGCEWPTIAAITGHETAEMARKYSEKKRRAKTAIARLDDARNGRKENEEQPKV